LNFVRQTLWRRAIPVPMAIIVNACVGSNNPGFIGSDACASCHPAESKSWRASQHALSMQNANERAVLGRFDSTRFAGDGLNATFFHRGNRYFVTTIGEDGNSHDYEIRWTFGVYPLQQYIAQVSAGRMQALTIAWDSRPAHEGGQHWLFLTPGEGAVPSDPLHWTGREYNWNYSCADCHSTGVRKGYDEHANQFQTKFAEINVACEACHGPASRHVRWARYPSILRTFIRRDGLTNNLDERRNISWVKGNGPTATRSSRRDTDHEIETCAQCHARRTHIKDDYSAGKRFFDYYIPGIIAELYYPDGQQRGEVYNYGSFLQSRMYASGVTCSDCHDPHTAKLRRPGNQVCAQCHAASTYDTQEHHHHIIAGTTGTCTSCHMPATSYMEIDARPDHSMRIPRPDLSITTGVPNACNGCHSGKSARWAAEQIKSWYPQPNPGFQSFAAAFSADDSGDSTAERMLADVANEPSSPWIVRASALGRLARYAGEISLAAARRWARDDHPLVRLAALEILEGFGAGERMEIGVPMLTDSIFAVRKGAAWLIAPVADSLSSSDRRAFDAAAKEFVESQLYNADQPGDRFILGLFFAQERRFAEAEAQFRAALRLDPGMTAAKSALDEIARTAR
jgi:predicted CXXCH cytochrome family protein